MTINNPSKYIESLWDWGHLDNCFSGTKIKISDIDGIVERNGYFLILETKLPGVSIPVGQNILLNQLIKNEKFTVFIVWGNPNKPTKIETRTKDKITIYDDIDIEILMGFVRHWFKIANNKGLK